MRFERIPHPGAWYIDALPGGQYGALYAYWQVETHLPSPFNVVPLRVRSVQQPGGGWIESPDNPLYLNVHEWNGKFYMAGQSHLGDGAIIWSTRVPEWQTLDVPAIGVSPVAFFEHYLYVSIGGDMYVKVDIESPTNNWIGPYSAPMGSQGIRYIADDGTLVSGDDTLNPFRKVGLALGITQLSEFTLQQDLVCGQGPAGCHLIELLNRRHLIEEGDTRFIRFRMKGDTAAISIVKQLESQSVHILADREGLLAREAPVPEIVTIGRPMWLGWFEHKEPPRRPPCNSLLRVFETEGMILRDLNGTAVAQYVAAEMAGQDMTTEIHAARQRHPTLPIIPYWVNSQFGGPIPAGDWIGIESYVLRGESDQSYLQRMRLVYTKVQSAGFKIAIIAGCYTSNPMWRSDLASCVPLYAQLAREFRSVVAILAFSDYGRATGLWDHPEAIDEWQRLFEGITGTPPIELIEDTMKPSKVTIKDPIAPFSTTGWELKVDDPNNNIHIKISTASHPGTGKPSWFVEITNPAGGDKSGSFRPVTIKE